MLGAINSSFPKQPRTIYPGSNKYCWGFCWSYYHARRAATNVRGRKRGDNEESSSTQSRVHSSCHLTHQALEEGCCLRCSSTIVVKTSGVTEPLSTSRSQNPYSLFFKFWCGGKARLDWNADRQAQKGETPGCQKRRLAHCCSRNPLAFTLRRASFFLVCGWGRSFTSQWLKARLYREICTHLIEGTSNQVADFVVPKSGVASFAANHCMVSREGNVANTLLGDTFYRPTACQSATASWNSPLCKAKPCLLSGTAVSHADVPFFSVQLLHSLAEKVDEWALWAALPLEEM